jgi:quinol monooxygenase YgiN
MVSMEVAMDGTLGGLRQIDKSSCTSRSGRLGTSHPRPPGGPVIFICVKWRIKPEHADDWPELTRDFTEATRAEEGNLFFEWARSVEDPQQYVLIEAFRDDAAEAHVTSDHFRRAQADLPQYVLETPDIRNMQIPGDHWDKLGEFEVGQSG